MVIDRSNVDPDRVYPAGTIIRVRSLARSCWQAVP